MIQVPHLLKKLQNKNAKFLNLFIRAQQFSQRVLKLAEIEKLTPYQILNVRQSSSIEEVKEAYRSLSKQYHPDVNKDKDAEQIFKALNIAYHAIKDNVVSKQSQQTGKHSSYTQDQKYQDKQFNSPEEQLYYEIFGKTYQEDPMVYYKDQVKREIYDKELQKMREQMNQKFKETFDQEKSQDWRKYEQEYQQINEEYLKYYQDIKPNMNSKTTDTPFINQFNRGQLALMFGLGISFLALGFYLTFKKQYHHNPDSPSEDQIEEWRIKREKKISDRKQELKEYFLYKQDNHKYIDHLNLPEGDQLLVNHTIYPDLKIYHVDYNYFYDDELLNSIKNTKNFEKHRMKKQQLNTLITMSLEAERCYKNIYIKMDTLKNIIEEQGYYEVPGVFQRYYGYLYFKLRFKNIDFDKIQKLHKKKKISLYDLYFYYSSPLPIIKDQFYDHKFFIFYQSYYVGGSYFNHRNIPKVILNGDEKHVYMYQGEKNIYANKESRYLAIWKDFYQKPQFQ